MAEKLDVGGVFSAAFSVYGARARTLIPFTFCIAMAVAVIASLLGEGALGISVGFLLDFAFSALLQGIAIGVLEDFREGRGESSVRKLLAPALPLLPRLVVACAVGFLGLMAGLLLLIVPGLYLLTIWVVLLPVILVERRGLFDAFGRSRRLVRGNGWRVFCVVLLLALFMLLVSFPLALILQRHLEGDLADVVAGALVSSLTTPLVALAVGVLYFRLREGDPAPPDSPSLSQTPV
jgi:hypothetical protein